mgnify:CR=1 FL=1
MKKIILFILATASLVACKQQAKLVLEPHAGIQNPIMPIVYVGNEDNAQVIHITDYLPQVADFNSLVFTTEPSYQVLKAENGLITITGDHTLSILTVEDKNMGIKYDIPIIPHSNYEVGLVTKSYTDSTVTLKVLNDYEKN